jgi:hypothetical protein
MAKISSSRSSILSFSKRSWIRGVDSRLGAKNSREHCNRREQMTTYLILKLLYLSIIPSTSWAASMDAEIMSN